MNKIAIFLLLSMFMFTSVGADDLMCNIDTNEYYARYSPRVLNCDAGQFLAANTTECVTCPDGYTCDGGELTFNTNRASGIDYSKNITSSADNVCAVNFPSELYATYAPKKIPCAPGYYLPANMIECDRCGENNYCPGGVYVFNETQNQGLAPCPDAHPFAPGGMWLESQCGRKMHIGDDVLYLHTAPANPTEHRFFVRFNDVVYSVNATEKEFAPATMSEHATRALHVLIDGVEYLIHDDSAQ